MKRSAFLLLACFVFAGCYSKSGYLQATNCECYLQPPGNNSTFQWDGACTHGFCDGFGTVRFFGAGGNYTGKYVGPVMQGEVAGFGTLYYLNDSIAYQGMLKGEDMVDQLPFERLSGVIGDLVVDSLLSGGINRHCSVVKGIFSVDGTWQELRYAVSCDGQLVSSNHYTCTVVFYHHFPWVNIIDANDNARLFITLNLMKYAGQLLDALTGKNDGVQGDAQ